MKKIFALCLIAIAASSCSYNKGQKSVFVSYDVECHPCKVIVNDQEWDESKPLISGKWHHEFDASNMDYIKLETIATRNLAFATVKSSVTVNGKVIEQHQDNKPGYSVTYLIDTKKFK